MLKSTIDIYKIYLLRLIPPLSLLLSLSLSLSRDPPIAGVIKYIVEIRPSNQNCISQVWGVNGYGCMYNVYRCIMGRGEGCADRLFANFRFPQNLDPRANLEFVKPVSN